MLVLHMDIEQGRNLLALDDNGMSDPYAKVKIGESIVLVISWTGWKNRLDSNHEPRLRYPHHLRDACLLMRCMRCSSERIRLG